MFLDLSRFHRYNVVSTSYSYQYPSLASPFLPGRDICCCSTSLFSKENEPGHEKMNLMPYANNKGADQPAHPRSLISAFVGHCLDSIISLVSIFEISRL